MSYDLGFRVPAGAPPPTPADLAAYFKERPWYAVKGSQALYGNEDTGVYFTFEFEPFGAGGEEEDEEGGEAPRPDDGLQAVPLTFNVNYVRPSVFGLEAERELTAVVQRFGLSVDDPQMNGMGRGPYSPQGFLAGWNSGNAFGCRAVAGQIRKDPGSEGSFFRSVLPAAELERCWRWNLRRGALQAELGEGVFVPRISFLRREGGIRSFVVWGDAMGVALPEVDFLLLVRQQLAPRRFLLFKPQDVALARYRDLGPLLTLAEDVKDPLPHHLFRHQEPPASLVEFFRSSPVFRAGQVGVDVDKILDAELMEQALAAPPPEMQTLGGAES
jgi:hypothetical protein